MIWNASLERNIFKDRQKESRESRQMVRLNIGHTSTRFVNDDDSNQKDCNISIRISAYISSSDPQALAFRWIQRYRK